MNNILSAILLLMQFIPFLGNNAGVYNQATNTITCIPEVCLHEVGHRLDDEAGFGMAASRDAEFRAVIRPYLTYSRESLTYEEVYAMMFEAAGGQEELMPEQLREFYDWDDINWMVIVWGSPQEEL